MRLAALAKHLNSSIGHKYGHFTTKRNGEDANISVDKIHVLAVPLKERFGVTYVPNNTVERVVATLEK